MVHKFAFRSYTGSFLPTNWVQAQCCKQPPGDSGSGDDCSVSLPPSAGEMMKKDDDDNNDSSCKPSTIIAGNEIIIFFLAIYLNYLFIDLFSH